MDPNDRSYRILKAIERLNQCGIESIIAETGYSNEEVQETVALLQARQYLRSGIVGWVSIPESFEQVYSANFITEAGKAFMKDYISNKTL